LYATSKHCAINDGEGGIRDCVRVRDARTSLMVFVRRVSDELPDAVDESCGNETNRDAECVSVGREVVIEIDDDEGETLLVVERGVVEVWDPVGEAVQVNDAVVVDESDSDVELFDTVVLLLRDNNELRVSREAVAVPVGVKEWEKECVRECERLLTAVLLERVLALDDDREALRVPVGVALGVLLVVGEALP
jgi:hypothetical protein